MRFLHCSDIHVTQDYFSAPWRRLGWRRGLALVETVVLGRAKQHASAPATLRRIVSDAERLRVDHVIVSGDVTSYASEEEFRSARELLAPFSDDPRRCTIVPGNHDACTPGAVTSHRFEKHFSHLLGSDWPEYSREDTYPFVRLLGEEAAVVGLCSGRLPTMPGIAVGRIGGAQLEGLRDLLNDARLAHRCILVVVHHAPMNRAGRPDALHHRLADTEALFQIVRGPRFAVLHGHIHDRYHHAATGARPQIFGAGSSTQRGSEGYWLIDVTDGRIAGREVSLPTPPDDPGRAAQPG
jgi:3',5'-cyclic AMP phosphodiesterase CpdA